MAKPARGNVYTRTGDAGTTRLFNGERRSKKDPVFAALGSLDELNSSVGFAKEYCKENGLYDFLEVVQSRILDLGSHLATPIGRSPPTHLNRTKFPEDAVKILEEKIDQLDAQLPKLTNLIVPGGDLASCRLHMSRAICRRAERKFIPLLEAGQVDSLAYQYINRLSDFLFVAARHACQASGSTDHPYRRQKM